MKKRIFSVFSCFLACLLCITCFSWSIAATDETVAPVDTTTVSFDGGDGSADNPYLISKAEQLLFLQEHYNEDAYKGKNFRLTAHINLAGANLCIGKDAAFTGTFDGNGYTVADFTSFGAAENSNAIVGMFGSVNDATIKNLKIVKATVGDGKSLTAGGVAGYAVSSMVTGCSMSSDSVVKGKQNVGGIVGQAEKTTIQNCINAAEVCDLSASGVGNVIAGGILGYSTNSQGGNTIDTCINRGNIAIQPVAGSILSSGGVIGYVTKGDTIQNCFSSGAVTGKTGTANRITAAGIAGRVRGTSSKTPTCTIENCYNLSTDISVSGSNKNAGLIVGYVNSECPILTNNASVAMEGVGISNGTIATDSAGNEIKPLAELQAKANALSKAIAKANQYRSFLVAVQEKTDGNGIRFLMGVDILDYANVIFEIDSVYTENGEQKTAENGYTPIRTVYTAVTADGKTVTPDEYGTAYFATMQIINLPDVEMISFTVRTYVTYADGTKMLTDSCMYQYQPTAQ